MANGVGLKITKDGVAALRASLRELVKDEVLVGFPDENAERVGKDGKPLAAGGDITNAALGYIHDTGMPEQNIPARPFMLPGMRDAQDKVADMLERACKSIVRTGGAADPRKYLERAGIVAATAIKRKINEGIPPPLADSTIRQRARGRGTKGLRQGELWELAWRAAGAPPGVELVKPLIDTGQLRNAITYVVRPRKARK